MKKKQSKKFPIWAIVAICVVAGLIIAGIVCFALVKNAEAQDLKKARELTENILETRTAVKNYFDAKTDSYEISDENKATFKNFEDAVEKVGGYLKDLDGNNAIKEGDAKSKYDSAKEKLADLQRVSEIEQLMIDAIDDGKLSDEELGQFENANSEYLQGLAKDYKEYRAKVAEFNEKYAELKGKNKTELDTDYAAIQQQGNELAKKYAEIKFEDVYGMSRDDILNIYATIEELNKFLAEKN